MAAFRCSGNPDSCVLDCIINRYTVAMIQLIWKTLDLIKLLILLMVVLAPFEQIGAYCPLSRSPHREDPSQGLYSRRETLLRISDLSIMASLVGFSRPAFAESRNGKEGDDKPEIRRKDDCAYQWGNLVGANITSLHSELCVATFKADSVSQPKRDPLLRSAKVIPNLYPCWQDDFLL